MSSGEQPVFACFSDRSSSSETPTETNKQRDICGWPERSVSAPGHRWALPLLCAFPIRHSEMFRQTEGETLIHAGGEMENE